MNAQVPKEPIFFGKTVNCLIQNNEPVVYPRILYESQEHDRVDYEVELAFIVGEKCKHIKAKEAYNYILGYTVFLDVTARILQKRDRDMNLPWYRSKNFDTFGAIGPKIVPHGEIGDPHDLKIELKLNGQTKQSSNTKHMIFKVPEILEYLSTYLTLDPGDIVATGTPSGVGPIMPGDLIEATVEKIGTLKNKVVLEKK